MNASINALVSARRVGKETGEAWTLPRYKGLIFSLLLVWWVSGEYVDRAGVLGVLSDGKGFPERVALKNRAAVGDQIN